MHVLDNRLELYIMLKRRSEISLMASKGERRRCRRARTLWLIDANLKYIW